MIDQVSFKTYLVETHKEDRCTEMLQSVNALKDKDVAKAFQTIAGGQKTVDLATFMAWAEGQNPSGDS